MSIINAFKELFEATYSGENHPRDYKLFLERYFPSKIDAAKITNDSELARKIPEVNNRSRVGQIVQLFENNLITRIEYVDDTSIENFRIELKNICDRISSLNSFASGKELALSLGIERAIAGAFYLSELFKISLKSQMISLNNQGFIVPLDIAKKQLDNSYKDAWDAAQHLGAVFPYERLGIIPSWGYVPDEIRTRFAKELLASGEGFIEIEKDYFGFVGRDRIFSQLRKIYSVYDEVPSGNVTASLYRTIKKKSLEKQKYQEEQRKMKFY